jgi:UDP-GlcNAc:undecaprenyl-phosphate GlcNAc-1-phosphate transferase
MFAKSHMDFCLRLVLYLSIPLVLYFIEEGRVAWISAQLFTLYNFSFGLVAVFVLLTVKFTRRTKGFRMTTMDFLIIFIAVIVPNLPDPLIQTYHLGPLTVKIIVLLFSYEVLIKELRGRFDALTASTVITLALLGIRGFRL